MSELSQKKKEKKRWLDDPTNVKRFLRWFYILCGCIAASQLIFVFHHQHAEFSFEKFPWFYSLFGAAATVVLVQSSKLLRRLLMRDEDYYDD